jgi:two-component system, sensor histidine kinase and response regulator
LASLLILLVDDDELSLEIVGLQLAAIGHVVVKATTAAKAIEILAESGPSRFPDAVFTDLQMPDMDGQTLCRNIRKLGLPNLRIFAMSGSRADSNKLHDFDGFCLKPLDLDSLRRALTPRSEPGKEPEKSHKIPPSSVVQMPEPALDAAVLQKLRVLMPPAALDELLLAYVTDTRVRLSQMERFADTNDQAALRSCAHMIKGSAAMTGASRIARIASQLETSEVLPEHQKVLIHELRCACDAIAGTLAREDRIKEAHDHQVPRIG